MIMMLAEFSAANEPEQDKIDNYLRQYGLFWQYLNQEEGLETCLVAIQGRGRLYRRFSEEHYSYSRLAQLLTEQLSILDFAIR